MLQKMLIFDILTSSDVDTEEGYLEKVTESKVFSNPLTFVDTEHNTHLDPLDAAAEDVSERTVISNGSTFTVGIAAQPENLKVTMVHAL